MKAARLRLKVAKKRMRRTEFFETSSTQNMLTILEDKVCVSEKHVNSVIYVAGSTWRRRGSGDRSNA